MHVDPDPRTIQEVLPEDRNAMMHCPFQVSYGVFFSGGLSRDTCMAQRESGVQILSRPHPLHDVGCISVAFGSTDAVISEFCILHWAGVIRKLVPSGRLGVPK